MNMIELIIVIATVTPALFLELRALVKAGK
jgi:hypothetical protein